MRQPIGQLIGRLAHLAYIECTLGTDPANDASNATRAPFPLPRSLPQTGCISLYVAVDRSVCEPLRAVWIAVEDVVHPVDEHLLCPVVAVDQHGRRDYRYVETADVVSARMEESAWPVACGPWRRRMPRVGVACRRRPVDIRRGIVRLRRRRSVGPVRWRGAVRSRRWLRVGLVAGVGGLRLLAGESRRTRSGAVLAAVRRSECSGECGDACDTRDHEFPDVVVHNAPSLSFLVVSREPISRLHQVRGALPRLLTRKHASCFREFRQSWFLWAMLRPPATVMCVFWYNVMQMAM